MTESPESQETAPQPSPDIQRGGGAHRKHTRTGLLFVGGAILATTIGLVLIVVGLVTAAPRTRAVPVTIASSTIRMAVASTISSATTEAAVSATGEPDLAGQAGETTETGSSDSTTDNLSLRATGGAGDADAEATAAAIRHFESLDISSYLGTFVRHGAASTGMVAVTFDDGPSGNTEKVLAALKAADVHATFFFVGGRAKVRKADVRDALAAGHELGNHTYSHAPLRKLTFARFDAEVGRAERMIREVSGYSPKVVRPFGGLSDRLDLSYAKRMGLVLVDWNVHSADTDKKATVASITANASQAPAGSIILMHETKKETAEAVPAILAKLKARGLKLVTVSELLAASKK